MTAPSTACPDWADRLRDGRSIIPAPLYPDEAAEALAVMRELRIVDAPGSPTIGEACAPWVFDFAGSLFGAYNATTGRREIAEWFLLIPKKNSKSTIAAAVMLTVLIRNWRQSAEFIILAPTVEVANNAFAPARDMVRVDDELTALLHVQDHIRTITHRETGATLKVVAADAATVGGKKAAGILIDEHWLFGKVSNAADMLREACGGIASRPEGFILTLSTQSDAPPAGVFKSKLDYARGVRDGLIDDPSFVPVLYEFPQPMIDRGEHLAPENFAMVNPNMDVSVDRVFLERQYKVAMQEGEESLRGFLAKHLNVQIGLALRSDRWAGADFWQAATDTSITSLDVLLHRCDCVVIGIDGGGLDDLLGLAAIGRCAKTRAWLLWTHAWAHEIVLDRRKDIAPALKDFAKQGDLTIVSRPGDDVSAVADIVCQVRDIGLLPDKLAIGVDSAGIGDIIDELTGPGRDIEMDRIIGISQGWKLTGAIKTAERKVAGREMLHGGRPLMAWCVGNARVEPRGNAIVITKQASGSAKIDPLMAAFNAVSLMAMNPEAQGRFADFITAPLVLR
jgi:phage terminase large subunit-like protein